MTDRLWREHRGQVISTGSEPILVRWEPGGPDESPIAGGEDVRNLYDITLDAPGQCDDLPNSAYTVMVENHMHDDIHAAGRIAGRRGRHGRRTIQVE